MSETLFEVEPTATAVISECGQYRYHLTRTWDPSRPPLIFMMCNPSKADAVRTDPTATRCRGFAERLGFGGYEAVNAYGYRATRVTDMWAAQRQGMDIVGPENDAWLTEVFTRAHHSEAVVVAAWGAHPKPERVAAILRLPHAGDLMSLGVTSAGQPRHPLMLRNDTPLQPWPSAAPTDPAPTAADAAEEASDG